MVLCLQLPVLSTLCQLLRSHDGQHAVASDPDLVRGLVETIESGSEDEVSAALAAAAMLSLSREGTAALYCSGTTLRVYGRGVEWIL